MTNPPEDFLAIATGAYGIDTDFKGAKLGSDSTGNPGIIAGDRRNQSAIGHIHLGDEFFEMVDDKNGVQRAKGFGVIQATVSRDI